MAFLILLLLFCAPSWGQHSPLVCIPGVERYSAKISTRHYYQCDPTSGANPELMECPYGQRYWRKMQECVEDTGRLQSEYLEEDSLGRNVQLGTFYNARTSMFFPESSLWTRQTIKNATETKPDRITVATITKDTLAKQKMEHMGMSADLTLKFMAGFITLHGHFGYIVENVNKEEQVNVQMKYYTKHKRSTLSKYTPIDYKDQCENPDVTHVVSTVKYGMGAVFNFQRVLQDGEERSAIEAGLETSIMIIPGISIGGGIDVEFNDTTINILNSTTIQMFGDFSPQADQPLPTTWNDSVEFYRTLPTFSGSEEDGWSGDTILAVTLTPIQEYCSDNDNILDPISEKLMKDFAAMFDNLDQLEVMNGGLLNSEPAVLYQPIRQNLNLYKTSLQAYRLQAQKELQEILPNILGDPQLGEEELVTLLSNYANSQFEFEKSAAFLLNRKREIKAVQYLMDGFPDESNIAMADYEMANDVEFIFKKEKVVVLEFNILTPKSLTEAFLDSAAVDESVFWFNNITTNGKIGQLLRDLTSFSLANVNQKDRGYLIKLSLIDPDTDEYTSTSALLKGQLISEEFVVPPKLITSPVAYIAHDRFKFSVPRGNQFVTGCVVTVTDNIGFQIADPVDPVLPLNYTVPVDTIKREVVQLFPEDLEDDTDVEIDVYDLSPGGSYSFHVAYLTEVGSGAPCNESDAFWIAPVSPPTLLSADFVSTDTIQLSWETPDLIAEFLQINKSLISYKIQMNGIEVITTELEYSFTHLDPGTEYLVEVRAFISKDITGETELPDSSASTVAVYTVPLQLLNFRKKNIGENFVELSWDPPANLDQAEILYYVVEYTSGGASLTHIAKYIHCKITNLARGSSYSFSVRVATVGGHSDPSGELLVETLYIKTEFEELKEDLENSIRNLEYDARAMSSFCSFKASTNEERLTYDNVFLISNNVEWAAMDISTGTFTAGATASYQISANLEMRLGGGQSHDVWMVVNDIAVEKSMMSSAYDISMPGSVIDNGSKNTVLQLTAGDEVYLAHQTNGEQPLNSVTFCISLITIE